MQLNTCPFQPQQSQLNTHTHTLNTWQQKTKNLNHSLLKLNMFRIEKKDAIITFSRKNETLYNTFLLLQHNFK